MIRLLSKILIAGCVAVLAGCGFSPVYTGNAGGSSAIDIAEIDGRMGYALRKNLQGKLRTSMRGLKNGGYLTITLDERVERLEIRPDGFASRAALTLKGGYVLTLAGGDVEGSVQSTSYFNIPQSGYGDITAQIDARQVAVSLLADKIMADLQLQLSNN